MTNIDNMTYKEIKEHIADLEKRFAEYVKIADKYFDLLDSIELFSKDLEGWEKFYNDKHDKELQIELQMPDNAMSKTEYDVTFGQCCAMHSIKHSFKVHLCK